LLDLIKGGNRNTPVKNTPYPWVRQPVG